VGDQNSYIDPLGLTKAPASVPNEPGVYSLSNDTLNEAYAGSALNGNDRLSTKDHKNYLIILTLK